MAADSPDDALRWPPDDAASERNHTSFAIRAWRDRPRLHSNEQLGILEMPDRRIMSPDSLPPC
ncbi:uncharacterized protein P884DRAFT_253187 [Thermothelomyces heterothallicus CBS 202.75]|uniref:uncharacterized protein n=1 Tax=Thermothelomyces heterothallicus CBS 202.75 TaxID=1149848 RepID=UPI0037432C8A